MASGEPIEIGIIGGVGQLLDLTDAAEIDVATPYGAPSVAVRVGTLGGRRVAFLSRRGVGEVIQPHLVPYRANVWALASIGVRALITTAAAGGLRTTFAPGLFVVTSQLIDRTSGRSTTFFDEGPAIHLSAHEPFDPMLRGLAADSLAAQQVRFRDFGTAVVIDGPRFSTRAESEWHALAGGDLVTMTLMPEVGLALELGIGVVNVSFLTDSDASGGAAHADTASTDLMRRRAAQAQPVLIRTITDIARTIPAGYRPVTGVPSEAIAEVLARQPR